ncbi:classical arabinogalactan protein 26-like [Hibiscus syriacus]|uniref:classical arabinogalactan protein 26-like n=1 Tax=Hibiscus syriacus TaxID=106335 RepID=UPI001923D798|nr:classical arabinogalactan protein 26-like [Hibiscus syriacus]
MGERSAIDGWSTVVSSSRWLPFVTIERKLFMFLIAYFSSIALSSSSSSEHVQYLTISAAPAFLPSAPLASSPSSPSDIEPMFPTPNGVSPTPSDSSMPTILLDPSPPNPDNILAPAPGFTLSPGNPFPVSASVYRVSPRALKLTLFLGFPELCLPQQLSGASLQFHNDFLQSIYCLV